VGYFCRTVLDFPENGQTASTFQLIKILKGAYGLSLRLDCEEL
jgi:hypothetical protein